MGFFLANSLLVSHQQRNIHRNSVPQILIGVFPQFLTFYYTKGLHES